MSNFNKDTINKVLGPDGKPTHPVDKRLLNTSFAQEVMGNIADMRLLSEGTISLRKGTKSPVRPAVEPIALRGLVLPEAGNGNQRSTRLGGTVGFYEHLTQKGGKPVLESNVFALYPPQLEDTVTEKRVILRGRKDSPESITGGLVPVSLSIDGKKITALDSTLKAAVMNGIKSGRNYIPENLRHMVEGGSSASGYVIRDAVRFNYELGERIHPHEQHFDIERISTHKTLKQFLVDIGAFLAQKDNHFDIAYLEMLLMLNSAQIVLNASRPDVYGPGKKHKDLSEETTMVLTIESKRPIPAVLKAGFWTYGPDEREIVKIVPVIRLENGFIGKLVDAQIATTRDGDRTVSLARGYLIGDRLSRGA